MNVNLNLLKKISSNFKKCNKLLNPIRLEDGLCASQFVRHSSLFSKQPKYRSSSQNPIVTRCYCQDESGGPPARSQKLPPLMNTPIIVWPSVIKSIKNLILTTFIIKPYLDQDFNLQSFVQGTKRAVEVVSHKLAESDDLDGLVADEIIPNLKENISKLSLPQRELIPINTEDIYFSFPYQIGIMFNDSDTAETQKRFVEITMVYHVLRGLSQMREQGEEPSMNAGLLPEYQERLSILNYRFIKEFTRGVESDWTVNLLNHFRPIDDE